MTSRIPILDSHIHLYPASELETLSWCSAENPLSGQHSVAEYSVASSLPPNLEGFIFVETDRVHSLAAPTPETPSPNPAWACPLMEVSWLRRIALGVPRAGEGHDAAHASLCKAIVPWAPLPLGPAALELYVAQVRDAAGDAFGKVRGFRYLVQGSPSGTMAADGFVEGLRWLGKRGYAFDVAMDVHRDGKGGLAEAFEAIGRAHEGVEKAEKVTFVLNHLCKPNMTLKGDVQSSSEFADWREGIYQLSRCDKTYMKLSGCFSEIDPDFSGDPAELFELLLPWLAVILAAFGPSRIMFGSDWPVCTVGGVKEDAWKKWVWIVERMCDLGDLRTEDQVMLWSGTAIKAYGIKELM